MEDGLMMLNLTGLHIGESDKIFNPVQFEQAHIIEFMEFKDGVPSAEQIRQRVEGLLSIIGLELGLEVASCFEDFSKLDGVNPEYGVLIGGPFLPQFMVSTLEFSIVDQVGVRVMFPVLEVRTSANQETEVLLVGIVEPQADYEEMEADEEDYGPESET